MDSVNSGEEMKEIIKPHMVKDDAMQLLNILYGFEGGCVTEMNGYDDLNYHYTRAKAVNNPNIKSVCPHGYILKVINSKDSMQIQIQEAQAYLMLFLRNHEIICSMPVKNKQGSYFSVEKLPISQENGINQRDHVVKLLEFQPGTLLKNVPPTPGFSLYYQIGVIAAKLNKTAKEFHHEAYERHESIWHLKSLSKAKLYTNVIEMSELKDMVEKIMDEFEREVASNMDLSQRQIIHGDLNSQNIICQKVKEDWKISAVIDFGDSHMAYPLYELAISMFYTMLDCKMKMINHFIGAGHTLAGYLNTHRNFNVDYFKLKQCISARLCQSYVLGKYNGLLQPENSYISECLSVYPQLLHELATVKTSQLKEIWENIINSYTNSM